ncbi:hypothetical protein [Burkholderia mayonis]|uniref:Uncharacterized protein n=1 Tax=Burkholderia mayonis TaxID=1385591 RepID=A0A1B4G7E9_9BURK|nr:hypothetical protein [Burkholderia mayonis]AOJ11852.1 hypothetical protein WS71_20215 [Burkholderia mayonis]KVE52403.1 hypothetical protein WS71_10040 [Burkholderia mayonis]
MLHLDQSLTLYGNRTPTQSACGWNSEYWRDAGYCIDAPSFLPAGSTLRFDPKRDELILAFAATSIAHR